MDRSDLAVRMKMYESVSRNYLTRRIPVIIRVDGKAFHSFTAGMKRPFDDDILLESMRQTMMYLCEHIQGCVLGYTQSDEITLVLQDYKTIHTQPWFEYNVQKCTSVAASMATMAFNKFFERNVADGYEHRYDVKDECSMPYDLYKAYTDAINKGAMFDARIFNVPIDDVCNNLIWRQQDAVRNSIQQVGQAYFSHKELHLKSCNMIQDMLMTQKGINWNDFPVHLKRGSCCVRRDRERKIPNSGEIITAKAWVIDKNIPTFTKDRDYIEKEIMVRED